MPAAGGSSGGGGLRGRILTLKKPKIGMFSIDGYISLSTAKVSIFSLVLGHYFATFLKWLCFKLFHLPLIIKIFRHSFSLMVSFDFSSTQPSPFFTRSDGKFLKFLDAKYLFSLKIKNQCRDHLWGSGPCPLPK